MSFELGDKLQDVVQAFEKFQGLGRAELLCDELDAQTEAEHRYH